MKKRIVSLLLAMALVVGYQISANASDTVLQGECGENLTWTLYGDTLTISGTGPMYDYDTGYAPWRNKLERMSDSQTSIKVVLENGVTTIGNYAFSGCNLLETVTIADSVTDVGHHAFDNCHDLQSVVLPDSVQTIGESAFNACFSLQSIVLSDKITAINTGTFSNCSKLESITIPSSVTSIGDIAFSSCDSLRTIHIPANVVSIGRAPAMRCQNLESITVDSANKTFASDSAGVLYNKQTGLLIQCPGAITGEYVVPASIIIIGRSAFDNCSGLTEVRLSASVCMIEDLAFQSCDSLEQVTLSNSIESIGEAAFWLCENLKNVKIICLENSGSGWGDIIISGYNDNLLLAARETIHNYRYSTVTAPTCTAAGYTTYTCSCGSSYKDAYTDALGHEWNAGVITTQPTATTEGVKTYTCTRNGCGKTKTESVPATGSSQPEESEPNKPCSGGASCPSAHFKDEPKPGNWAHAGVDFAISNGLFNGTSATTFGPEIAMNRAMLVTVLWRYEGQPSVGTNQFKDVPAGQWYTQAISWASANGIVTGVGGGKFNPTGLVTREQMATILYRYCGYKGIDNSNQAELQTFPDAGKVGDYAQKGVSWAVAEGLISGKVLNGVTCIDPCGNATRAQVATIMMRFVQNVMQ